MAGTSEGQFDLRPADPAGQSRSQRLERPQRSAERLGGVSGFARPPLLSDYPTILDEISTLGRGCSPDTDLDLCAQGEGDQFGAEVAPESPADLYVCAPNSQRLDCRGLFSCTCRSLGAGVVAALSHEQLRPHSFRDHEPSSSRHRSSHPLPLLPSRNLQVW